MVNAHLLVAPAGCVLVDTGLPGSKQKIRKALRRNGMNFGDIRLIIIIIIITHARAHLDHAGSALAMRKLSGAPLRRQAHRFALAQCTKRCIIQTHRSTHQNRVAGSLGKWFVRQRKGTSVDTYAALGAERNTGTYGIGG